MIIVTGGAGFIGSRIIKELNQKGHTNIVMVDDMTDAIKINNIRDLQIEDYIDKENFIEVFQVLAENKMVEEIYHLGAESSTTCSDGKYLMSNNYQFTCNIMNICSSNDIPLVYASSASVYGDSTEFDDKSDDYMPNNMYGFSKLQADKYARDLIKNNKSKMIGCRYFNVYSDGEFETHKDGMKSPTAWMKEQYEKYGQVELFEGSDEFKRDFIHIDDVVKMTISLMKSCKLHISRSGVYNVGTGTARSFVDMIEEVAGDVNIEYIKMPETLSEHYQSFTEADMSNFPADSFSPHFD
jgi:ADP-L-glycero-D-manno-heptose 6-epimerase